jgi:phospholipid/cholesterol/gamma-HCH transport system permease protein
MEKTSSDTHSKNEAAPPHLEMNREGEILWLHIAGTWRRGFRLPAAEAVETELRAAPGVRRLAYDTGGMAGWDSLLLTFLLQVDARCAERGIAVETAGLAEGVRRLLALAEAVPEKTGMRRGGRRSPFLARLGERTLALGRSTAATLAFMGETFLSVTRLVAGKGRFRGSDLLLYLQESGAGALPIITLTSLLVGLILAFMGAVQLRIFGAEIYIANLVGLGMARDMGPMMTAIIMAGRTGAAYAAQLGAMQGNDEIDAFRTLGISPMDYLVLPRLIALTVMVPLLTVYADVMGIVGGALVGVTIFDITPIQYLVQTRESVALTHFGVGLTKSAVYGGIVAFSGCLRGMLCGRSAADVGAATTSAVVTAIVWIIVACAVLTVIFHILGI